MPICGDMKIAWRRARLLCDKYGTIVSRDGKPDAGKAAAYVARLT
jgi:hypothetical protein